MSIPTTETKPDGFHSAVRPQARNIREMIETAGPSQQRAFLSSLIERSSVNNKYLVQLLLSAVLLTVGLFGNLPLLIFVAAVCAPVLNPLLGMVTAGTKPDNKHLLKSTVFTLLTLVVFFGVGWLTYRINPAALEQLKSSQFFSLNASWLEWLILVVVALLSVWLFLYRTSFPPVIPSTILVYLIFLPVTFAGLLFAQGQDSSFLTILARAGLLLCVCLLLMILSFWVIGFRPRRAAGWLLFSALILGSALLIFEVRASSPVTTQPGPEASKAGLVSEPTLEPTTPPSPTLAPSLTPEPSPSTPPTETLSPSDTAEPTELPTLAVQMARVIAESGVVVRENPDTAALILAYLNYGTEVIILGESVSEQGINWEKVELSDGTVGWSTSQFLEKLSEDN